MSSDLYGSGHETYIVTVNIMIPFEHDTQEKAELRAQLVRDYVLEALPGCEVKTTIYPKGVFRGLS
jgi:hypothetical protein